MSEAIIDTAERVFVRTYTRPPFVIERGKGSTLWDTEGRKYTDFIAGIAVCGLGHAHPRIARVLARQAETLLHVSNLYYTIPQTELAESLVNRCFADRVFFCNSGAEANEAAIKLSRKYFHAKGNRERFRMIAAAQSFHGRTMATLSATGQDKVQEGYAPLLAGFDFVPYNDLEAIAASIGKDTCAVILEPIQGEGGVRVPDTGYLQGVRDLCDRSGTLLIFDEIQTGMGRTGKLFAHQHAGVSPDIMTLAKALGNGLPIGAMLTTQKVADAFGPGAHASTFGGTPIVTAAALETLRIIEEEGLLARCREIGDYFKAQLLSLKDRHKIITDVRGQGLLLGLEIEGNGGPIVEGCLKRGFLVNCIQGNIFRFAPPLIIEKEEINGLIACLDELLSKEKF